MGDAAIYWGWIWEDYTNQSWGNSWGLTNRNPWDVFWILREYNYLSKNMFLGACLKMMCVCVCVWCVCVCAPKNGQRVKMNENDDKPWLSFNCSLISDKPTSFTPAAGSWSLQLDLYLGTWELNWRSPDMLIDSPGWSSRWSPLRVFSRSSAALKANKVQLHSTPLSD